MRSRLAISFASMFAVGFLLVNAGTAVATSWTVAGPACRPPASSSDKWRCGLPNIHTTGGSNQPLFPLASYAWVYFDGKLPAGSGACTLAVVASTYTGTQRLSTGTTSSTVFDEPVNVANVTNGASEWDYVWTTTCAQADLWGVTVTNSYN